MSQKNKPSIFEYLDVVQFLQNHFQWRKSVQPKFSYSTWCEELNLGSKTILRFMLQRKRRISKRTGEILLINLGLTGDAAEYFEHLLSYSQPRSEAERKAASLKLILLQRAQYQQVEFDVDQAVPDIYGPIILTLLTFHDFLSNAENISKSLGIDLTRVKNLLALFKERGLVEEKDGQYSLSANSFKIPNAPQSESLKRFHSTWLDKAKNALDLDFETRRFRSLKFALSESEFESAVEKINEFALSVLNQFHNSSLAGRRLYMLESALFPISEKTSVDHIKSRTAEVESERAYLIS